MKGECGSCGKCMYGRGAICNDPVAGITRTLTLVSPFCAASIRGFSAILLIDLYAYIVQQKRYTRETCRYYLQSPSCRYNRHKYYGIVFFCSFQEFTGLLKAAKKGDTKVCIWLERCGFTVTISDIYTNLPARDPSSQL